MSEEQDIMNLIAGAGTEDIQAAAPILEIIQKGSPQVDATHKDYKTKCIDGASPGDIVLLSTNTVVKKAKDKKSELEITPLAIGKCYVEFKPKSEGGGFVNMHPLSITAVRDYRKGDGTEKNQYREFLGKNELTYTVAIFAVATINGEKQKVVIRLKSTQLKKARDLEKALASFRWNGVKAQPPIFARTWLVTTVAESNDSGGWFGWEFTPGTTINPSETETLKELFSLHQEAVTARTQMMAPRAAITGGQVPALTGGRVPALMQSEDEDEDHPF